MHHFLKLSHLEPMTLIDFVTLDVFVILGMLVTFTCLYRFGFIYKERKNIGGIGGTADGKETKHRHRRRHILLLHYHASGFTLGASM